MRFFNITSALLILCAPTLALAEEQGTEVPTPSVEADPSGPPPDVGETPAESASGGTSPWIRLDTDSLGTQFWFGASHDLGAFAIASDIYVVGSFAEFDIGPSLSFGNLALTPMVGIGFDFSTTEVASLIAPQLFSIFNADKLYFESWIQVFFNSVFTDGAEDIFYTRNFLLYKLNDTVHVGPQAELSYRINEQEAAADMEPFSTEVTSLPVGGRVNLAYGEKNTLGIFLGYETESDGDFADAIAGRFTFIRAW